MPLQNKRIRVPVSTEYAAIRL